MDNLPINPTDLAVLAVLLLSALLAFARGFVREVLSVAAWAGAALAAYYAYPHLLPFAQQYVTNEFAAVAAAAGGVFLLVLIVLTLMGGRMARTVRGSALSPIDRSLGFLFGLLRGGVLVCLAYLLVAWVFTNPGDQPEWLRGARTMPAIESGAEWLRRLVPDNARTAAGRRTAAALEMARAEADRKARDEVLRRLSMPVPAAKSGATSPESGYKPADRASLDQFIGAKTSN